MRCGGFAIIEGTSNYTCVDKLENDVEVCDDPESYMEKEWGSVRYGIGKVKPMEDTIFPVENEIYEVINESLFNDEIYYTFKGFKDEYL